jgi:cyclophilin family peptidyl-prolyl cis-trans isomerase
MGTDKRERQKANRDAKLAAQAAQEAKQKRNRFVRNVVVLVIAIIVTGFLLSALSGCSSSDSEGAAGDDQAPTTEAPTKSADGLAFGTGECPPTEGVTEPVIDFDDAPGLCIDPDSSYVAEVETTEGTVTVELDTTRTPLTTNNFVALARFGYYEDTSLFRTEARSGIIQGGSPHTQDNSDPGPGYTIPDEALPFTSDDYAPGALAMARTSEPDSASAQFFFLANEGGAYLGDEASLGDAAGSYVVFGRTTEGLDVLEKIANLDDGSGSPSQPVSIVKVTISER